MSNLRTRRHDEGVALLVAAIFTAVALIVITALGLRVINASRQAQEYELYAECFNGAQAGYAQSIANLEAGVNGNIGLGTWAPPATPTSIVLPSFSTNADQLAPVTLRANPAVQYISYVDNWFTDKLDNNTNGAVDDNTERGLLHHIRHLPCARGWSAASKPWPRRKTSTSGATPFSRGNGQAGGLINGNVSIHGSVHLLGQRASRRAVSPSTPSTSAAPSLIHNNYVGIPAALAPARARAAHPATRRRHGADPQRQPHASNTGL